MIRIGVDVGSTFTKYCILNDAGRMSFFSERTPVRQREAFAERAERLREKFGEYRLVSCGYGRENVTGEHAISELTALAAGAARQCPQADAVLDIGGQDTKVICQSDGRLKAFFVNERCAAGCGLFLGNVLNLLGADFHDVDVTRAQTPKIRLSSVCAVFAQTEIVGLLAAGAQSEEIILAVLAQIFVQARTLLDKVSAGTVALSGGLSQIPGIAAYASALLEKNVVVPERGPYLSAIGCALYERKN